MKLKYQNKQYVDTYTKDNVVISASDHLGKEIISQFYKEIKLYPYEFSQSDAQVYCDPQYYYYTNNKHSNWFNLEVKVRFGSYSEWLISTNKIEKNDIICIVDVYKSEVLFYRSKDIARCGRVEIKKLKSTSARSRDTYEVDREVIYFDRNLAIRKYSISRIAIVR